MYPFTPPPPPREHFSVGAWVLIGVVVVVLLLAIGALLREARDARFTTEAAWAMAPWFLLNKPPRLSARTNGREIRRIASLAVQEAQPHHPSRALAAPTVVEHRTCKERVSVCSGKEQCRARS